MKKLLTIDNLCLLTIFCMPLYLIRMNIFGLPLNVFEFLAILSIMFLLLKERKKIWKNFLNLPRLLLTSIAFILVGVLLSILFNNNYQSGFGIFKSWFLVPIVFSFLFCANIDSKKTIEKVFLSIYLSTVVVGIVGIIYKTLHLTTYDGRLETFYSSPNYLAISLSSGLFFGFYFLAKIFLENRSRLSKKFLFACFSLLPILLSIYFTYSYGAWIATLFSLFFIILILVPHKKFVLSTVFVVIVIGIFTLQLKTEKFSDLINLSERSSLASRIIIWKSSALMVKQYPVMGIGSGNFQDKYLEFQKYFPPYLEWAVPEPHNVFLAFWLQAGILGIIGFVLLLLFVFKKSFEIIRNKKDMLLVMPLFGFFVYSFLHGLIDTTYWKNDFSFLFWISVFLFTTIYIKIDSLKQT